MKNLIAAGMLALTCVACSNPNAGGPPLTTKECDAFIRKGWEVNEMPADSMLSDDAMKQAFNQTVQSCATRHEVSRKDYTCVMKASNLNEFQACNAVVRVR